MTSNYKRIGDFIRLVDVRNKQKEVETLLGLSISKEFIPSVANTVGTNMANYKIIKKGQFSCSLMQVRRDKKIPVALLNDFEQALISQAYPVFEIEDTEQLFPEYLMMWMSRSEFDRHACFLAVGGVRGSLEWDDFCDMELPVPSIEKQREIVREYNVVNDRIALNEKITKKLEDTVQTIYKQWFVDFEFSISKEYAESIGKPELVGQPYKSSGGEMEYCEKLEKDIPKGWGLKKIIEICDLGSSKRVFQDEYVDVGVPFYRGKEISLKKKGKPISDVLYITNDKYLGLKEKFGKPEVNDILITAVGTLGVSYLVREEEFYFKDGNVIWIKNYQNSIFPYYIYDFMQTDKFVEFINDITIGSTQGAITIKSLGDCNILMPKNEVLKSYSLISNSLKEMQSINIDQKSMCMDLRQTVLSKIALVN